MIYNDPRTLDALLSRLASELATYLIYQIDAGAQYVQIFDSWGGLLPPDVRSSFRTPLTTMLLCMLIVVVGWVFFVHSWVMPCILLAIEFSSVEGRGCAMLPLQCIGLSSPTGTLLG